MQYYSIEETRRVGKMLPVMLCLTADFCCPCLKFGARSAGHIQDTSRPDLAPGPYFAQVYPIQNIACRNTVQMLRLYTKHPLFTIQWPHHRQKKTHRLCKFWQELLQVLFPWRPIMYLTCTHSQWRLSHCHVSLLSVCSYTLCWWPFAFVLCCCIHHGQWCHW